MYTYVPYGCATVALLCNRAAGCVTGHPVTQQARTQRNFTRQVILQPHHFIRQLQADLTTYHVAAEFQKYIESAFPVDGKRNRSAVILFTHLKGAASAGESKAFLYLVYSLNEFAKPARLSICIGQFSGNVSYPVAQPSSSIRIQLPNWAVLYCPVVQPDSPIHLWLPNQAALFTSGCPTGQLYSRPVA